MFLVFLSVPLPNKPPDMSPIFPGIYANGGACPSGIDSVVVTGIISK